MIYFIKSLSESSYVVMFVFYYSGGFVMNKKLIVKKMIAVACAAAAVAGQTAVMAPSNDSSAVITASAAEAEESRSYLGGATLTLTGEIGVNFYLSIPENSSVSTIVMTGPNGEKSYALSDLTPEADGAHQGMYKVTYLVAPAQIEEDISLVLQNNGASVDLYNDKGVVYTDGAHFSVRKYIDAVNKDPSVKSELSALVYALDLYGKYSAAEFGGADDPGLDDKIKDIEKKIFEQFKSQQWGDMPEGLEVVGATLLLDSQTTYRIYFNTDPGEVLLDDQPAEVKQKNGKYYIEIADIPAPRLDWEHRLEIGSWNMKFTALSYVYSVLENETDSSKNIHKLVRALYAYHFASSKYFDSLKGYIDDYHMVYDDATISPETFVLNDLGNNRYSFEYNGMTFEAIYSSANGGNWHIEDSYRLTNGNDMCIICERLQETHKVEGRITQYRTAYDMADEWVIHNYYYSFVADNEKYASFANRLKSVDLNRADQGKSDNEFILSVAGDVGPLF